MTLNKILKKWLDTQIPRYLPPIFISIWSVVMIVLCYIQASRFDYPAYEKQWALVLENKNPWSFDNVYGPLHNILAVLYALNDLGPKIFMVITLVIINFIFVKELNKKSHTFKFWIGYSLILPGNYLTFSMAASFGTNDTLVAALIGTVIIARRKNLLFLAGFSLGLAILLKIYPLFILPAFFLNFDRKNLKVGIVAIFTTCIGFALSALYWGSSTFTPFSFGALREPKYFSILLPLTTNFSSPEAGIVIAYLAKQNTIITCFSILISFIFCRKFSLNWIESSVILMFTGLLFNKGTSEQYYLPLLVLLAGLTIWENSLNRNQLRLLLLHMFPFVIFVSIFAFSYELSGGFWLNYSYVRYNVGFLNFILGFLILISYFYRVARREKVINSPLNYSQTREF